MLISKLKSFVSLVYRVLDFYNRNGMRTTVSTIHGRLRREKKYSHKTLLNEFPKRFTTHSHVYYRSKKSWAAIIDSSAQEPLERILDHFHITGVVANILSMIKSSYTDDTYYRTLHDLFTLEQVMMQTSSVVYPVLRASGLPPLSKNPLRRRILFITSQFPSPYHGGGNRILNFMKVLSENNDIYLATAYYPYEDDKVFHVISPYCCSVLKIPHWHYGDNRAEILEWLNHIPMDIIHYEWADSLINHDPAYGRFHIFTYMEAVSLRLFMDLEKIPPLSTTWLATFTQFIHALRMEVANTVPLTTRIAVTTKDGEFFRGIYPYQEYAVLNHGVNLDEFTLPDTEPEPQTLVFVGNFGHYPNADAMTHFFAGIWDDIRKEVPDIKIYLVGPNPPAEITLLDDNRQIIVTGGVPDVRPYIQKATVCVAPLITGAGLRGKVIEYAALRRTFVATSIATTDLVYEDGIDYLMADTPSDFAKNVIHLLRDDKLRQKMAGSAYETTQQNYDTRRLVNFLYRLYEHLELEHH